MKHSRIIVSRGLLIGSHQSLRVPRPDTDSPTLKFTPLSQDCHRCSICSEHSNPVEIAVSGLVTRDIESIGTMHATGVLANLIIEKSRVLSILWHTLLLPLSGFVSGAALGQMLLQTEVAAMAGAVAGLVIAAWCTRQIPPQAVTVEIASINTRRR